MDVIIALWQGILIALEPINLGLAVIGVVVGLFVGAMPGLGSVNGVAILLLLLSLFKVSPVVLLHQ